MWEAREANPVLDLLWIVCKGVSHTVVLGYPQPIKDPTDAPFVDDPFEPPIIKSDKRLKRSFH